MKKLKVFVDTCETALQKKIDKAMEGKNIIDVEVTANKYVICIAVIYEEVL